MVVKVVLVDSETYIIKLIYNLSKMECTYFYDTDENRKCTYFYGSR